MVSAASAAEVVVAEGQLVVKGVDDSLGLGAFSIVIGYDTAATTVTDVTFVEPFMGAVNIQQDKKTVRVSGFTTEQHLTGDVPVAEIQYTGDARFDVYVNDLVNPLGDPIPTTNPAFDTDTPASPGAQPTAVPTTASGTGSSSGGSQPNEPQATATLQEAEPTPTTAGVQQTAASESPAAGTTGTVTGTPETPTPAPTPKSPLSPIIGICALVLVVFAFTKKR
ncbi:hypothetical protein FGU65_05250 [Methanoculleus sp. FWC-SCC1]|uniref:PGF-CTERM sorting domain-containing protein n=1 Tax=Methanoculleus frigidifontis TaxID=2584085 RepID=A0ABT8M8Q4_9EURY|nr:hypothetical protein [Methanoculleus sp. FWC-SCC1]MDN7024303.1 hypothetical protein [Methanoculleus sp. FWC-SCC1]